MRPLLPPQGIWFPLLGSNGLPLVQIYSQKEPISPLPLWHQCPPRKRSCHCKALSMQMGLTAVTPGSSESSTLPVALPKGPLVPCHITSLKPPSKAFKHIGLKASGKEYAYGKCDKTSSNWEHKLKGWTIQISQIFNPMVESSITCCFTNLLIWCLQRCKTK